MSGRHSCPAYLQSFMSLGVQHVGRVTGRVQIQQPPPHADPQTLDEPFTCGGALSRIDGFNDSTNFGVAGIAVMKPCGDADQPQTLIRRSSIQRIFIHHILPYPGPPSEKYYTMKHKANHPASMVQWTKPTVPEQVDRLRSNDSSFPPVAGFIDQTHAYQKASDPEQKTERHR